MKMKHTVKLISGNTKTYVFPTKRESDKVLKNAFMLNNQFHTIRCIWIEPLNQPEKRERIDLQKLKANKIEGDSDMTMKATKIKWDIDYDDNGDLPTEIEIPEDVVKEATNEDGIDDEVISDYITDLTGYCHCGFEIEIKK